MHAPLGTIRLAPRVKSVGRSWKWKRLVDGRVRRPRARIGKARLKCSRPSKERWRVRPCVPLSRQPIHGMPNKNSGNLCHRERAHLPGHQGERRNRSLTCSFLSKPTVFRGQSIEHVPSEMIESLCKRKPPAQERREVRKGSWINDKVRDATGHLLGRWLRRRRRIWRGRNRTRS